MSDDPVKFILGDTAISAVTEHPGEKRGFFGRKRRARTPLTHCENCGEPLTGKYCAKCGQPAIDYRRSFRHVLVDVLESFLSWDSKFFATIAWLIVRPWHLTNEFLAGRRVRYVHPLRLYLLASILFFFAVNYWAKSLHLQPGNLSPEKRTELTEELKKENMPPEARAKIEKALKLDSPTPAPAPDVKTEDASKKEGDRSDQDDFGELLKFGSEKPSTSLEKWLKARAKEKIGEHGTNAQLFLMTVISNLPYMMLCCIPLFAFRSQDSLHPEGYFLHRSSRLRAAHSQLCLSFHHDHRARDDGTVSQRSGGSGRLDRGISLVRFCRANFLVDPPRLPAGLVLLHLQVPGRGICLLFRALYRSGRDIFYHAGVAVKNDSHCPR